MGYQGTAGSHVLLADDEVQRIATEIVRAVHDPRPDDPRDDILSPLHELPPVDEGRVAAAAAALQRRRG